MRLSLPFAVAIVTLVSATDPAWSTCEKDRCWGAIAFSRLTGYWVYSMNHPDAKAARSRAWRMCKRRCTNVVTVRNGCLALVIAPKGRFATAVGQTENAASSAATTKCGLRHRTCLLQVVRCTADFEALKRQAREKARRRTRRPAAKSDVKVPPAKVEELKF